ncbi:MAG: uroporphyrinogen-III C-methyltransferase [Verrucomicrobiota bacterium]
MKISGKVYLVGAGPGDAGLLTLRGAELLARADVVIYDALVNPALLRLAPATAEFIHRGKRTDVPQENITAQLITLARAGKIVVRLKGGDPFVFGRGGEEAEELAAEKIPFEIIPGVSSITAVPNYAGIPLTHRAHCSSFTVFTGHSDSADAATALRYEQIAKIPGTKIVLMGTENLGDWTRSLVANGLAASTPVALIQWGTTGRQKSVSGTLADIAALAAAKKLSPPALAVIGDVVKLRGQLNWFEQRPLLGQRVVVTRARAQADELVRKFSDAGADVLEIPVIKFAPPQNLAPVADALLELNSYDWLVFTSANGVDAFFSNFFKAFEDMRDIGGVKIAAVGPVTAARLKALHLKIDLMPDDYRAAAVAKAFEKYESIENLKICLLRAEVASPELPLALEAHGAIVDDIACYRTVADHADVTGASAKLLADGADWLTFTSGSTVNHFHERFDLPTLLKKFPQTKIASIGPETTKALLKLDLPPTLEAKPHTMDALVAAVLKQK